MLWNNLFYFWWNKNSIFLEAKSQMYGKLVSFDGSSKIERKVWKLFTSCMWHRTQNQKNLTFGPSASVTGIKFIPNNNLIKKKNWLYLYVLNDINVNLVLLGYWYKHKKYVLWNINSVIYVLFNISIFPLLQD